MFRLVSICFVLFVLCAACFAQEAAPNAPQAKNIIVMIADGWGYNHVEATDYYLYGELSQQAREHQFKLYGMDTHSSSGVPYDPEKAWADFAWVKEGATDSAAAATAMSTGSKTVNGAIGVDEKEQPLEHIADVAEKKGKATGVITSVLLSHATPAGFSAHDRSRGNYEEIAKEMILQTGLDVIMGCGHPDFDKDGKPLAEGAEKSYRYVGGEETWKQLLAGQAGGDCDGDGTVDPWSMVQTREAFQALANGETPKRVIGVVPVQTSLQVERKRDDNPADDVPFQDPLLETVPTLAEMSLSAINVLDNDPDGFFLMIEGGAVDWASHAGHGPRMIEEMVDYYKAVEAVVSWVEKNSNWNETLVIVTGDHECGYLTGPDSDPDHKPVVNNGKGNMPGVKFNKGSHTNSLIPIYVKGAGAELFDATVVGTDPKRGPYIDNTSIGIIAKKLME